MSPSIPFGAALTLGVVSLASVPAAADEGETAISAVGGFASFQVPEHRAIGGALGVDYERGWSDSLWLRASASGGLYRESGGEEGEKGLAESAQATLGLTYVVDVIKYVPFVNLGVGGIALGGEMLDWRLAPLVELGGGLDILQSRSLSYGLVARFESLLSRSAYFSLSARRELALGFFLERAAPPVRAQ